MGVHQPEALGVVRSIRTDSMKPQWSNDMTLLLQSSCGSSTLS